MFPGKCHPLPDHISLRLRKILQHNRILDYTENGRNDSPPHIFRSFCKIPLQHIRMHCGTARSKAQIGNPLTVVGRISRTVSCPEHISELSHSRSYISLTEFQKNVRLDCPQTCVNILHQHINRLTYIQDVPPGIIFRHCGVWTVESEFVYEIKFESIQVPFFQGFHISPDKIFPHLGKTRIQNGSIAVFPEEFASEKAVSITVPPHKRNAVPNHIFHPQFLHPGHVGSHIREF